MGYDESIAREAMTKSIKNKQNFFDLLDSL